MKKYIIFITFILSFNSFAEIIFDYNAYSPINCKKRNSELVNYLKPFIILENKNELTMILLTSIGQCKSKKYIKYPRASIDMYDTSITAGRFFNPLKYPAQADVKPLNQTDLIITLKFDKRRIFKKYNYMDFDFDFIYHPGSFGRFEKISRWLIELEKIEENTRVKLIRNH